MGPTGDDITKPVLCEYFESTLIVNDEVLEHVKNIFKRFNRPLIKRNIKQAEVPHNCTVLLNERGTAPGMWFEKENTIYVSLPGVPHEMKGLMENAVIPKLKEQLSLPFIIHKTAVTIGQAESALAEILNEWEDALPVHIKLAYLPHYRMVKLRLTARGENKRSWNKK